MKEAVVEVCFTSAADPSVLDNHLIQNTPDNITALSRTQDLVQDEINRQFYNYKMWPRQHDMHTIMRLMYRAAQTMINQGSSVVSMEAYFK